MKTISFLFPIVLITSCGLSEEKSKTEALENQQQQQYLIDSTRLATQLETKNKIESEVVQLLKDGESEGKYKSFYNSRFECSIVYPSDFIPGQIPGNNDGRTFYSQDKKTSIACYGSNYVSDNLEESLQQASENISVSYKTLKTDFYAFSGYDQNGNIYYQKSILTKLKSDGSEVLKSVCMIYPQNQKGTYDEICKIVAASLK